MDKDQRIDNREGVAMSLALSDADEARLAAVEIAMRAFSGDAYVADTPKSRYVAMKINDVPLIEVACKAFALAAIAAATGAYMTLLIFDNRAYFTVTRTFMFTTTNDATEANQDDC